MHCSQSVTKPGKLLPRNLIKFFIIMCLKNAAKANIRAEDWENLLLGLQLGPAQSGIRLWRLRYFIYLSQNKDVGRLCM